MVGKMLIGLGLILVFIGLLVSGVSGFTPTTMEEMIPVVFFGALITIWGLITHRRQKRLSKARQKILQDGVVGEGRIKFLDRNYRVEINGRPVYSIIEYDYVDSAGNYYINRVDNVDTDAIIRTGWQVGSTIPIKYLSEDARQSTIIMPE